MRSITVLFMGFFMLGVVLLGPGAVAQEAVSAPTYLPGESWVYDLKEERSEEMGSSVSRQPGPYKMEVLADGSFDLHPTIAMSVPSVHEGAKTLSGIEWFKFPFKVGDTWPVSYVSGRGKRRDGTVTVLGRETVTVPAGTFETYKLIMAESGGTYDYDITYYYAPAAKATVRIIQKRTRRGSVVLTIESALVSYHVR